jgi:hypothetical protein
MHLIKEYVIVYERKIVGNDYREVNTYLWGLLKKSVRSTFARNSFARFNSSGNKVSFADTIVSTRG